MTVLTVPRPEMKIWGMAGRLREDGFNFRPQVGARPASILMSLEGTINPLAIFPSYREIARLPLEDRVACLREGYPQGKYLRIRAQWRNPQDWRRCHHYG